MSKGKRGIGLDKPCPKCGSEVPASFVSPLGGGLCGKCTDEMQRVRAPKPASSGPSERNTLNRVIPGGGSTLIGFAIGLGIGVFACLGLAVFGSGLWTNIVAGIGDLMGR